MIQDFIERFGYPVGKLYANKVEYRSVGDLDKVTEQARQLILKNNLPFKVVISGSLAQTRSFIVEEVLCLDSAK